MKVKNIMFSGFAAAILMGVVAEASAAPVAVASKGYVDSIAGAVVDLDGAADGAANLVQAINFKQDKLTAGDNIAIAPDGTISATDTNTTYTAGDFVAISDDNVITTTYAEGSYIDIDDSGKISATISAGDNVSISETGVISATDTNTTYTAGDFVAISDDNVITTTYTAGDNITIDGTGKISAQDTTYTAGTNITIDGTGKISTTMPAACQNEGATCVLTSEGGIFAWAILTKPFDGSTMTGEAAQAQSLPEPVVAVQPQ